MTGPRLLYLVGEPGCGKSTAMRALTGRCMRTPLTRPFHHQHLLAESGVEAVELGAARPTFSGTDSLSLSVQPVVLRWMHMFPYPLLLGEGDRLGGVGFMEAVLDKGWSVDLAVFRAGQNTVDERCRGRGTSQSEAWRKGRRTKVETLATWAEAANLAGRDIKVVNVDAEQAVVDVVLQLGAGFPLSAARLL